MNINLNRLSRFVAVYRNKSFSRAANELGMTHSALTKSLQLLEQELGTELFNRTTRSVVPTDAGNRLAQRAEELLALADQIGDEVLTGTRHLRLIAGPAVMEASLAPALTSFYKAHPNIRVTAETLPLDIAASRLRQREADMLLFHSTSVSAIPEQRLFHINKIIDEAYVAVMRKDHPVLQRGFGTDEMLQYKWAIPGYDRNYRSAIPAAIEEKYRRSGFPHYRVLSLVSCLALVAESDMITLLPASFANREARALDLTVMPMPLSDGARYNVSAITLRNGNPDPALIALKTAFATQKDAG
jgi:DNA-binding transcriptional LysR family regulator